MQSVESVDNNETLREAKNATDSCCNLTSPMKAMANAQILPNGSNSFNCERCVDDGELSEVIT